VGISKNSYKKNICEFPVLGFEKSIITSNSFSKEKDPNSSLSQINKGKINSSPSTIRSNKIRGKSI